MESLYIKDNLVLIDFSKHYSDSIEELLSSKEFEYFIEHFLKHLAKNHHDLIDWMQSRQGPEPLETYFIKVLKALSMISFDESFTSITPRNAPVLLKIVEEAYRYWRDLSRFSLVYSKEDGGLLLANFLEADERFNALVLRFYRSVQEKLQGYRNSVYRQLQAGSNGSLFLCRPKWKGKGCYDQLAKIPFIQKVMLRSPIIISLKHNKRIGTFTSTNENPLDEKYDYSDFMCFPIMVGSSLTYVYFHKDFTASAIGLANLFEFVTYDHVDQKPECIILFGVKDEKKETTYYYDKENDIYIGKISYMPIIEYFGSFKKMALTLHNLVMIKKGFLPIHGAMMDFYLKDGRVKGVCLMGDSGAGKSETIEALNHIDSDIERQELVFDDMGAMYINKDGQVVAIGTETGAFVRLDDLDASTAYKDLDRSIFFNPGGQNARVITPASQYSYIMQEHKVDIFLYANNYTAAKGIHFFENQQDAKKVFVEGKRQAIGTTNEKGLSTTYFANPFGPMQEREKCEPIIDEVFNKLLENGVRLGEIYTNLGLENKGYGGLEVAARELLKIIEDE